MSEKKSKEKRDGLFIKFLNSFEKIGNKLPDPTTIFFILWFVVIIISVIVSKFSSSEIHPGTGEVVTAVNLLSKEQMQSFLTSMVSNFTGFAPLGTVLVTMLGIGLAEKVGLMEALLKSFSSKIPKKLITASIILIAIVSNCLADAGFIVFPPLAGLVFLGIGRNPLIGIFAAYAGISAGYSANIIISVLDTVITSFTTSSGQIIDSTYTGNPAMNYYFLIASTFVLTGVGVFVTEKYIAPRFNNTPYETNGDNSSFEVTKQEKKALKYAGISVLIYVIIIICLCIGENSFMLGSEDSLLSNNSTLMAGLVPIISILFFIPGLVYGIVAGKIKSDKDVAKLMYEAMSGMGSYIVLAFVAGQFLALFNASNISSLLAIKGARLLENIGLTGPVLIVSFVIFAGIINLFVGSASAKWAIMAPIFVPMFMLLGYSPALTQMAYRIGDSITNPISPLGSYLPLILVFAKKYDKNIGIGTVMSSMIPYSFLFGLVWIILLVIFMVLSIPLGPGGDIYYSI